MRIKVYPKINLALKVYKGEIEGKHRIDTIMYLYKKIHDTISIKKFSDLYITYKIGQKEVSMNDCIIYKSLKYLEARFGININYRIKVTKRIPFGGGMGGGSADAAAVIGYVLFHNKQIQLDLKEIALVLGSDIPFFLTSYDMARVKDFGQYVAPIYNWKPKISLKFNNCICSTKKVFDSLEQDEEFVSKVNIDRIIKQQLYKQHGLNVVYNDLTKYIIQNYKELQPIYSKYSSNSFFTGSGSTIVTLKG